MILVGLGANLHSSRFGSPRQTLKAATGELQRAGLEVVKRSRWFESAPVPASDQPWFVNGVISVRTSLDPADLLELLLATEEKFGRIRTVPNAPRVLDLDLLAYDDLVTGPGAVPELPHPRLHQRAFVLYPIADIAPEWRHPVSGLGVSEMLAALPAAQVVRPCPPPD